MAVKKKKFTGSIKARAATKGDFVRGVSADLSAKEVVAQAKAKGISLTEAYFYKLRSASKAKTRKTSAPRSHTNGPMTKIDFVRSLPAGISYAEAAEKGKAAGIVLSKGHFYVLKSELRGRAAPLPQCEASQVESRARRPPQGDSR